jgi:hypothetical protein
MKYITIATHDCWKSAAILFSPQISHADMAAKWPLNKPIGAGFVTFHDGQPACVGFSTSLNLGPDSGDILAVRIALSMTHVEYPDSDSSLHTSDAPASGGAGTLASVRSLCGAAQVSI